MHAAVLERGKNDVTNMRITSFRCAFQGRAVHTYQLLVETSSICHELNDIDHVMDGLNGKLVSVSGPLTVPEVSSTIP